MDGWMESAGAYRVQYDSLNCYFTLMACYITFRFKLYVNMLSNILKMFPYEYVDSLTIGYTHFID